MYEQANLKVEIKENRFLNGDTFYLWHLSILTCKARKVNCFYALNREAMSVLQSLSLNSLLNTTFLVKQ